MSKATTSSPPGVPDSVQATARTENQPDVTEAAEVNDRTAGGETSRERTVRQLTELVAALDRRVPQVERTGEVSIARAAAQLRADALKRVEELQREAPRREAPPDVQGAENL